MTGFGHVPRKGGGYLDKDIGDRAARQEERAIIPRRVRIKIKTVGKTVEQSMAGGR